jgi:2-polyprenyl-6-hydroxyphenyl methylase/3-demethylubiquinone-9 3-methyltransferase
MTDGTRRDRQAEAVTAGTRAAAQFEFGRNWSEFAQGLRPEAVEQAVAGLRRLAPDGALAGRDVLDIGCGSGLHAVAALRLGAASVTAIDLDPESVATAARVLARYAPGAAWSVSQRSVFAIGDLPRFPVVYSWGVLHHTGDMRRAIRCAADRVAPGGLLIVALYRRTPLCGLWRIEKRLYVAAPQPVRRAIETLYTAAFRAAMALRGRSFRAYVEGYVANRGMDWMTDVRDWLGGYPYESISEAEMLAFAGELGLAPVRRFCHRPGIGLFGTGCDEYVFARPG